jgi:type II secretory pathway pseudopilin PulG
MKTKGESGFSMVELVMATAITGLIIGFLGTSIYQMFSVTDYGNNKLIAMHELQNAAYWFQHDGQEAMEATGGKNLVLTLADNLTVTYTLNQTRLERTVSPAETVITPVEKQQSPLLIVDPVTEQRIGGSMVLAKNITEAKFTISDRLVTMSLTSSPEGRDGISENGVYQVYLRPAAEDT